MYKRQETFFSMLEIGEQFYIGWNLPVDTKLTKYSRGYVYTKTAKLQASSVIDVSGATLTLNFPHDDGIIVTRYEPAEMLAA